MYKRFIFYQIIAVVFLLQFSACCKDKEEDSSSTVTDIEGNTYKTIKIGNQWWMAENLKVTKYNDGTPIPYIADNLEWIADLSGAYCCFQNDISTYKETYGCLYNWYACNTEKLAPIGWHIPTDGEWHAMILTLDPSAILTQPIESYNSGGKLKEIGTAHWIGPNSQATDEVGFTGLPSSFRSSGFGTFPTRIGERAIYMSITTLPENNNIVVRALEYEHNNFVRSYGSKVNGFAIRCIKD